MSDRFDILAIPDWYRGLPHQRAALEFLWRCVAPENQDKFVSIWRQAEVGDGATVIDWRNPNFRISKFFTVREVTQNDSRRVPAAGSEVERNILRLAHELDKVREEWGRPIGVTSWYRPAAINRAVGGVENSQHITGAAADIYTLDGRDQTFEHWLDQFWGDKALGYGVRSGRGFTHVDLRPGRLRWDY